jgi:hypothetical protein
MSTMRSLLVVVAATTVGVLRHATRLWGSAGTTVRAPRMQVQA